MAVDQEIVPDIAPEIDYWDVRGEEDGPMTLFWVAADGQKTSRSFEPDRRGHLFP